MVIASLDFAYRSMWIRPGGGTPELTEFRHGIHRNSVYVRDRFRGPFVYIVRSMPTCMLFPYGLQSSSE